MKALKVLIIALIFLAACQNQPAAYERPPVPSVQYEQPEEEPEQPEETTQPTNTNEAKSQARPASAVRESIFATRKDGSKTITPADILCDLEDKKLTFRFTNHEKNAWQLNNDVPFNPPEGLVGVYVVINQYEANGDQAYYDPESHTRYFGPNETFSENCQGTHTLEPGQTTTCTLYPVPLRNRFHFGGVNEIFINAPGPEADGRVEFTCS